MQPAASTTPREAAYLHCYRCTVRTPVGPYSPLPCQGCGRLLYWGTVVFERGAWVPPPPKPWREVEQLVLNSPRPGTESPRPWWAFWRR